MAIARAPILLLTDEPVLTPRRLLYSLGGSSLDLIRSEGGFLTPTGDPAPV
jgi:hypothetical protein